MQEEDITIENMLIFHLKYLKINIGKVLFFYVLFFHKYILYYIELKLFKYVDKSVLSANYFLRGARVAECLASQF